MYKDILRSIVGIEIFPVISLCLFVFVFAVVLVWTSRLDRAWLARSASLPLEPDTGPAGGSAGPAGRPERTILTTTRRGGRQ